MSDLQTTVSPAVTIGRYRVVGLIAHGGMGSLYLAHDPAIGRTVAIKLLRKEFDDEAARERFAREARSTGHLRHPNIVTVFDVGEHDQRPFIAMEYVPGETLAQLIRRRASLSIADRLAILEDLCVGLHVAHAEGIVHRDIKPANVILDVSGTIKILDFGLAHASDSGITNAGDQLGTLNYMSPEQVVGGRLDHRSDVYAVGVLAYELMSYTKAFPGTVQDGTMYRILNTTPTPLEAVMPGVDPEISRIIERAMLKEPERRHQNAEELREDFATLRKRLAGAEASPSSDVQATADARPARHALAGIARDSSPLIQEALASSAKTVAQGSAGESPMPARPAPPKRGRLKLAAITVAAVTAILAAAFYRNASLDRPEPSAGTDAKPPAFQSAAGSAPAAAGPTSATSGRDSDRRAIDERLNEIRATARRQLAAGDHSQLLNTLSAGLVLDAGDVDLNGLIDELKRDARQLTVQARTNASRRGATEDSSVEFRDGRAREREGETLDRSGDRAQAIRALWAATELYGRAARTTAQRGAPPATPPPAPQPQVPVAKIETPPLPERQSSPVQPPAPESDKPPPPSPPLRAEPSIPAPVEAVADARASDTAAIEDTLRRYASAYRSLDIAAVRKVLPSLNAQQLRSLENDLSNYRSYTVELADPRIAVDRETATAKCQVTRSFVTKSGVAGGHTVATTFHLRKIDAAWVIERVESR
jgi:eukaryotic-like serine/threonine-protein kinase